MTEGGINVKYVPRVALEVCSAQLFHHQSMNFYGKVL